MKLKLMLFSIFLVLTMLFVVPKKANAEEMPISWNGVQEGDNLIIYTDDMSITMRITDIYVAYQYYATNQQYLVTNIQFNVAVYFERTLIQFNLINEVTNILIPYSSWNDDGERYFGINIFGDYGAEYYISLIIGDYQLSSTTSIFQYTWEPNSQESSEFNLYNGEVWTIFTKDFMYFNQDKTYEQGYFVGKDVGYRDGETNGYASGYAQGYASGVLTAENDFDSLFSGIANTPITILHSVLSFDIFGINIFNIIFSILTLLLLIWLIKRFI